MIEASYRVDPDAAVRERMWVPGVGWADARGKLWIGPGEGWHIVDLHSSSWLGRGRVVTFRPPDAWYELCLVERSMLADLDPRELMLAEDEIDAERWPNIHSWAKRLPMVCVAVTSGPDAPRGHRVEELLARAGARTFKVGTSAYGAWSASLLCSGGGQPEVKLLQLPEGPASDLLSVASHVDRALKHLTDGVLTFSLMEALLTLEGMAMDRQPLPGEEVLDRDQVDRALANLRSREARTRDAAERAVQILRESEGSGSVSLPGLGRATLIQLPATSAPQTAAQRPSKDAITGQRAETPASYTVDGEERDRLELPAISIWRLDGVDPWEPIGPAVTAEDAERAEAEARTRALLVKIGLAVAIALLVWWVARG